MSDYLKKTSIFLGVGAIIIIGIWVLSTNKINQSILEEEINPPVEEIKPTVFLVIDDGEGLSDTFVAEFKEGMTAFDLLKEGTEKLGLTLKTKTYDIGIFIEAIGDKENGQDQKYWLYYLNNQMPQVAADKQEIKDGDKVEFKFEKSPF